MSLNDFQRDLLTPISKSHGSLDRLMHLMLEAGINPSEFNFAAAPQEIVNDLIQWAMQRNRIESLLEVLYREDTENPKLREFYQRFKQGKETQKQTTRAIRIQITEEPLTAQTLSTAITAISDLYTRCWLIQQKRFADLMDYAQTHDPRFVKEANLQIGTISHNSPTLIDFLVNAGGIAGGAATLVFALKNAIDAVAQAPLRYEEKNLENKGKIQEQLIRDKQSSLDYQIAAKKAEAEDEAKQQEQRLIAQKEQIALEREQMLLNKERQMLEIEVEREGLEFERERLEFERNRVIIVQEIAVTMVGQLLSSEDRKDAGRTEMLVHSLIPSLLQLAATDAVVTAVPAEKPKEENKGTNEEK